MQSNDQTVLFLTIRFSLNHLYTLSLNDSLKTNREDLISCYHLGAELMQVWWKWKGISHFPIRLFNVISRTHFVGGFLFLCRDPIGLFYSPSRLGKTYPLVEMQSVYSTTCRRLGYKEWKEFVLLWHKFWWWYNSCPIIFKQICRGLFLWLDVTTCVHYIFILKYLYYFFRFYFKQ